METVKWQSKRGNTWMKFRMQEREYHYLDDNYSGLCVACGSERDGCESDARKYPCPDCSRPMVYGIQELTLMGLIEVTRETLHE